MKGTDEQCSNFVEAFAVPTSTSAPRFFLWGILMLASVPLFDPVVRLPQAAHLDRSILDALIATRIPALIQAILIVMNVFAPVVAVLRTIVLGGVIRVFNGSWCKGLIIPAATVCSSVITAFIKKFTKGIRPVFPERLVAESSYSFPSGHAIAVAVACAVGMLLMLHHLANRVPSDEDGSFL